MKKVSNQDLGIVPGVPFVEDSDDDELPNGMTEAEAERIANEAIRRRNLIPGRKSLSGGKKHSPVLQVRLPEDVRERLNERARGEGVSASKVARRAITEYLEQR